MPGLDPVVEKTMEVALATSDASGLRIDAELRWMSLFPVLIDKGYSWHMDNISDWLEQKWPGPKGRRGMNNRNARKVYAWAQMALEQANPRDQDDWAEYIIQKIEDELAG